MRLPLRTCYDVIVAVCTDELLALGPGDSITDFLLLLVFRRLAIDEIGPVSLDNPRFALGAVIGHDHSAGQSQRVGNGGEAHPVASAARSHETSSCLHAGMYKMQVGRKINVRTCSESDSMVLTTAFVAPLILKAPVY